MKNILLRLTQGLYNKVKAYADANGISVVGAIRSIIHQFFNNRQQP